MQSLYTNLTRLSKRAGFKSLSEMCDAAGISRNVMTELKKGRSQSLSSKTAEKLCAVLNVTMDVLYGVKEHEMEITDDDIKFALFGGDSEITDEMYEEVKKFAQFVKAREKEKNAGTI
jgi:transcriptional regulator with XRE-family HTH domain